ncbi:HAMP domain-containing histidine kinase [Siccirubricoccus sp. KC 17139]|uniref:histidine kinase n=1 Tax=Siccirubricoccus soli TaxID=2899147 RepID=A0ABT1DCR8_9PROT|nr:HAMP domain-containing sensor histidine kinase [Siccirubricoccus soli]MCO6419733.1 HAMP domain-containing histidine kinase [Siccirubricoccus soli]MCP2685868.1 HAMP domain-containing histidine kinase [Siccirubricoccus soli]
MLHLSLTLLGTIALSAVAWWATTRFALQQIAAEVERDTGVLLQSAQLGGPRGLALAIEARIAADASGTQYFLLAAPNGTHLAGNLARAPRGPGWETLALERPAPAPPGELLAFGTPLPGGAFLTVARDIAPVRALEATLLGAAGWVGGAALLLGLAGGTLLGRSATRRAAAMETALARIELGEMTHRLPVTGSGDDYDRLAARINATLDRLAVLMTTLRQVTDDIAHDLRTPLNRLRQRLEAALRDGDAAAAIPAAIAEADHLLEIFAALLRIAQVEAGARRAGFAPCDLSVIAESVAEVYAPAAEERGQVLETAIAPGIACQGDRELLTQALANLLDNAVKHGREGGRLRLALGAESITVADDGPGIPPEERELVLRRFYRRDAARSTPGSGLGLALVAAVAELHGMALRLEDNAPGLRVVLALPSPGGPPPRCG